MPPQCGVCQFRGTAGAAATYAFVLAFDGRLLADVRTAVLERAQRQVVAGCSAYCRRCRCVTWLAHGASEAEALLRHEHDFAVGAVVQKVYARF